MSMGRVAGSRLRRPRRRRGSAHPVSTRAVAQLVECTVRDREVAGSSPAGPSGNWRPINLVRSARQRHMLKFLLGDPNARVVRSLESTIQATSALEREFEGLDAARLSGITGELRSRLAAGATLDAILPPPFAAVRQAAPRA